MLLQESKTDMSELQLKPEQLAEMVGLIEDGTISGKIGKQILPDLLQAYFYPNAFTHMQQHACLQHNITRCLGILK